MPLSGTFPLCCSVLELLWFTLLIRMWLQTAVEQLPQASGGFALCSDPGEECSTQIVRKAALQGLSLPRRVAWCAAEGETCQCGQVLTGGSAAVLCSAAWFSVWGRVGPGADLTSPDEPCWLCCYRRWCCGGKET